MRKLLLGAVAFIMLAAYAQAAERRIALVVGNANYPTGALPTPANDAGLVAQTLQAAGFDVTGARDLDQASLRSAFRDFLDKASASGADTVAFIYLSGYGLQLEGENYFVPIDARINRDADVTSEALRLADLIRPLAALRLKAVVATLGVPRAAGCLQEQLSSRVNEIENVRERVSFPGEVGAEERDRDQLRPARFERVAHQLVRREFAGADEQPRREFATGDGEFRGLVRHRA